jgi:hypothetical protein
MNEGSKVTGKARNGVYVGRKATFTMNGGVISGNTASSSGGGVYVRCWYYDSSFIKTGGTIYGSNAGAYANAVKNASGVLANDSGHAVYASAEFLLDKRKETTAGPDDNLSFIYNYNGSSSNSTATFSGGWDY